MRVKTKHLGEREVPEERLVTVRDGLFGFDGSERFALIEHSPESPFFWLQSLTDPDLAFVAMSPTLFRPDYVPQVAAEDLREVGLADIREALVLAVVVIPEDARRMTANLQGPLVFHPQTRVGKQMISSHPDHQPRHYVVDEMQGGGRGAKPPA